MGDHCDFAEKLVILATMMEIHGTSDPEHC